MTILWRPLMAVGDATVDADHQTLIELINAVELILLAGGGRAKLATSLDQLSTYAKEHFEREEGLMRHTGFGGLEHHHQAHRGLRSQLVTLRTSIETAADDALPPEEVERLAALLRHWLLDHVFKEDMLLKPFLKSLS